MTVCPPTPAAPRALTRFATAVALTFGLAGAAVQAAPVQLQNAGFEADWTAAGVGSDGQVTFNYGPTGPDVGWTFAGGGGVAASYNVLTAYEGRRFGLLQLSGSISQAFSLDAVSDVTLDFALSLRPGYNAGQSVRILVDGVAVGDVSAGNVAGWRDITLDLGTLQAGVHELMFAGLASYAEFGDTTAYLDAVRLDSAPPSDVPEPASLALASLALGWMGAQRMQRANAARRPSVKSPAQG